MAWQTALDRRLERSADRLERIDWSNALLRLSARSSAQLVAIDWHRGVDERVRRASMQLVSLEQRVEALSPVRVLERGYAVVRAPDGGVIRAADQVVPGQKIAVQVAKGTFTAVVAAPATTGPLVDPTPTSQLSPPSQDNRAAASPAGQE